MTNNKIYDCIVIGAGHAGLEACMSFANKKMNVALITLHEESIGMMPCNPSIGGPAKGIVTREIDALGGMQAIATDENLLQIKILNLSKGPGVWALRAQVDKVSYHKWWLNTIKQNPYIDLIIDEAIDLIVENNIIKGVKTNSKNLFSKTVIITAGTYLKSVIHKGDKTYQSGPDNLNYAKNLSSSLTKLGFSLIRLKTGTPARIHKDSIDYSNMTIEPGTDKELSFSLYRNKFVSFDQQLVCYVIHTNETIHNIIRQNLDKSAMYSGKIQSIGPRYCPSIEDKIVKFWEKPRHQIFIEPESKYLDSMYLSGYSTSMPESVQDEMIKALPGFENAQILKYAYAIEYDAIDPTQLDLSLMSKNIKGLFFAGQINGTSGYEEAAGQGLIAGINAIHYVLGNKPLILSRTESYIGVMIDDIVTKGILEPYRLLTSRAEHRLYLRNDNADDRLIKYGYKIGLISDEKYSIYTNKINQYEEIISYLKSLTIGKIDVLKELGEIKTNQTLYDYVKRPEINLYDFLKLINYKTSLNKKFIDDLEIRIKFEGYIKNQEENIRKLNKIHHIDLSQINDYKIVPNLSLEAIDKLNKIKPINLDQASRISGITLNDIAKIKYFIESNKNE